MESNVVKNSFFIIAFVIAVCGFQLADTAYADTLTLKDGQVLKGTFTGRTSDGVKFNVGGQVIEFKNENVQSLDIDVGGAQEPAPAQQPASAPAEATQSAAQGGVTLPAGTRLVVRTDAPIDSRQHKAGHKFTAKLEADLVADGVVVASKGSTVYGQLVDAKKSGRLRGKSEMTLTFTDIMIKNQMKPISTSQIKAVTEETGKSTAGKVAGAAAIGGLVDGSSGAKTGAKVGVGASILTSGNQINIPAGTMLEFQLAAPFSP